MKYSEIFKKIAKCNFGDLSVNIIQIQDNQRKEWYFKQNRTSYLWMYSVYITEQWSSVHVEEPEYPIYLLTIMHSGHDT